MRQNSKKVIEIKNGALRLLGSSNTAGFNRLPLGPNADGTSATWFVVEIPCTLRSVVLS